MRGPCSLQLQAVGRWPPPALQTLVQKQPGVVLRGAAGFSASPRVVICRFRGRSPPDTDSKAEPTKSSHKDQPKGKNGAKQEPLRSHELADAASEERQEVNSKQLQTVSDAATAAAEAHAEKLESAVQPGTAHVTPLDTADLETPLPTLETAPSAGHIAALDVEAFAGNATSDDPSDEVPNVTKTNTAAPGTGEKQDQGSTTPSTARKQGKGREETNVEVEVDVQHGLVDFTTEEMRESAGTEEQRQDEGSASEPPAPERQDAAAAVQRGQATGDKQGQASDSMQQAKLQQTGRGDKSSGGEDHSDAARAKAVLREMENDMREGADLKATDFMAIRQSDLSTGRSSASPTEKGVREGHESDTERAEHSPEPQVVADRPVDSSAESKKVTAEEQPAGSDVANDAPHDGGADVPADIPADVLPERATDPGLEPLMSPLSHPVRSAESGPAQDKARKEHRQHQLHVALQQQLLNAKQQAAEEEVQELVDHPDAVIAEMQHQPWGSGVLPEYVHALADAAAEVEADMKDQSPPPRQEESSSEQDETVARARSEALSKFTEATGQDSSSFLSGLNSPRVRSHSPAEEEKADKGAELAKPDQATADTVDTATEATANTQADMSTRSSESPAAAADPAVEAQRQGVAKAASVDADEMPAEHAEQPRSKEPTEQQSLQEAMAAASEALEEAQEEQAQMLGQPTQRVQPSESTSNYARAAPRVTPEELAGEAKVMLLEAMCEEVRAVRIDMQHAVRLLKDMKKALAFTQQTISKLPPEAADNLQQTILQEMARLEVQINSAEAGMSSLALAMTHLQRGGPVPALETVEQYMQYIEGMAEVLAEGAPGIAYSSTSESSIESSSDGPPESSQELRKKALTGLLVKSAEVVRDELAASLKEGTDGSTRAKPVKRSRLSRRLMALARSKFGHVSPAQTDAELAMQLRFVPEQGTPATHPHHSGKQPSGSQHTSDANAADASGSVAAGAAVPAKGSSAAAGSSDAGVTNSAVPSSSRFGAADDVRIPAGGAMKREPPIGGGGGIGDGGARPPRPTAEGAGGDDSSRSAGGPVGGWLLVCSVAVGLAAAFWQAARHYPEWSPFVKRPAAGSVVTTAGTDGTSSSGHPAPHTHPAHSPHPLPTEQQGLHHVWHQHQDMDHIDAAKASEEHHRTVLEKASDAAGHVGELLVAVPHLTAANQHEHTTKPVDSAGEHKMSKGGAASDHHAAKHHHVSGAEQHTVEQQHASGAGQHAGARHSMVHTPTAKQEVVEARAEPQGTGHAVEGATLPEALQECGQELKEVVVAAAEEVKEFQDTAVEVGSKGLEKARVRLQKLGKAVQDPEGMLITLSVAGAMVGIGRPPFLSNVFSRSKFSDEGSKGAAAAAVFDMSDRGAIPQHPGNKRG